MANYTWENIWALAGEPSERGIMQKEVCTVPIRREDQVLRVEDQASHGHRGLRNS